MITLTTDFGYQDHYVAVMKAVIYRINPQSRIVDITHGVRKHDVRHAAYILRCILPHFSDAIHVFVVDPGVGTERKSIAARLSNGWYVGPDNGILTLVQNEVREVYEIMMEGESATFHGRDIFAPAAARLEMGEHDFLKRIPDFVRFPYSEPRRGGDRILGEVIHIDHFGNIITNIPAEMINKPRSVLLKGRSIPFKRAYGFADKGELIALINSEGLLEFGVNLGSAAERLSLKPGDSVEIRIH